EAARKKTPNAINTDAGIILTGKLNSVGSSNHGSKTRLGITKRVAGNKKKKTKIGSTFARKLFSGESGFFDTSTSLSMRFIVSSL
ncbi:MAG: hypothetical protein ABFS03_12240, partial [Chloroflexota bacterium]